MRANNNNTNNSNNYRAIVSTAEGITTGTIAGVTTDRIINWNQENNQIPGTTEHYTTRTTGVLSHFMIGAERMVARAALPQEALVHLKRKATQTSKEVEASSVSPAHREIQTTYEEEAKVHLPISTSGLAVGAMVGVAAGLATSYFLKEDDKPKTNTVIEPQEMPAIAKLSEEEQQKFQEFAQPDPGRLSPVSKMQYEHLKKIHDTTTDKNELLQMKFQLHDMAKRNT